MDRDLPIAQLMSTAVHSVQVDQKLSDVRKMLASVPYHHLPVAKGKKLVGMLSTRDLAIAGLRVRAADPQEVDDYLDRTFTLEEVMSTNPISVQSDATLYDACDILANGDFHALPVVRNPCGVPV
ncbi:MAG: CBS domain-containing protein [Deltaproteobacteria bacterium]|nr:CBS domain-containing protein [Deltaproteobacteria bacterium]